MINEDERKREIEDVARKLGISEDAIDAIVNGKPLPRKKKEPRIKKWNTGWELRDLLSTINIRFDFFDAVIEGKLTPYDEKGLEVIESYIDNPFRSNPPECRYATITYDNVFDFLYKGEELEKFVNNIRSSPDAKIEAQKESIPKQDSPDLGFLSNMGKKGGEKSKINRPILAAAKKYMEENPKIHDKANENIARKFCNKYKENTPMTITIDNAKWEVFYQGEIICSRPSFERHDRVKADNKEKSIKYMTFWKNYISKAKKQILTSEY